MSVGVAAAQEAAQPKTKSDPASTASAEPQSTVTVVGRGTGYRSTIDRKSYSIGNDLQKDAGALADVLRNVPSVQVGSEGDVSIRGDSNVTILIDGKPSALFSGPGRAQAIQSLPADQYERVEVMTNPSAAQTAEGSGGVINLISKAPKKGAAPSANGSIKASYGSGDRYDVGVSGTYDADRLTLSGSASWRRGRFARTIETRYGLADPMAGVLIPAEQLQDQDQRDDSVTLSGALGYDLTPHDHFSADLTTVSDRELLSQTLTYRTAGSGGITPLTFTAPSASHNYFSQNSGSLGLTHSFPGEDHSLSVKLSYSDGHAYSRGVQTYRYAMPVQPDAYQDLFDTATFPQADLKLDYKTPLPNKAKLGLGYEGRFDWQEQANSGLHGISAATATVDPPSARHDFTFHQQVHALYVTYEQAFGSLTMQSGLRLENATLQTDLASPPQMGRQAHLEPFPSLHLAYDLDDRSQIKFSYGRRIQRPDINLLDPYRTPNSPVLYSAGNPNLQPTIIQSVELGYEYHHQNTDLQANLFFKDKTNTTTQVRTDIGGGVLLSTWQNLGHLRDVGVELVANHELFKTLTVNASGDFRHSEANVANLAFATNHSAYITSVRATVNWQASPRDFVQLGVQAAGRQLSAQGFYGGAIFNDFGWRHKFDAKLASLVTVQDPFGISRRTIVTDTPTLVSVQRRQFNYTSIFIGFTYAFGGASKRSSDNFDFGDKRPGGS